MLRLNRRVAALKPSATLAMEARAGELKQSGVDIISLAAGEPDFDTPERIKEAARKAMAAGATKYTPAAGIRELKQAICAKLKRDNGLDYKPTEVMAAAGGKQAIYNVVASLFDEGDEVIIPTPAWVSFAEIVRLSGAEVKLLPTRESDGFQLRAEELKRALTPKSRGIILNSPCNPTGAVTSAEQLSELAKVMVEANLSVIFDGVYEHIIYVDRPPHLFAIEPRLKETGIVVNSLSKTYAMTGWRVGFAAGPAEVIGAASRLQGQNSGNPNSIAQAAAVEALNGPQDEVRTMAEEFRARNRLVVERIRSLTGFKLVNVPEGAFYAFPNVSELLGSKWPRGVLSDGNQVAEFLLEEAKVAVVGGNDFGAPEHVRMSYATSRENLEEAFKRIANAVRKLKS
ncbi:MAG TPA: pyridoxal phosphate-dependent aminotransferase [Candidatus Binataceae bacterium]|nr:pyridoxal phosphate-dependent aminotransferase [Candidatus Binataceae bacterium]